MAHRFTRRLRCAALGLPAALSLALPACSGSGDALSPDPEPPHHNPPPPPPGPPPGPPPQQPIVAGRYVLGNINEAAPGNLVTLANPDGIVIGLYRFDAVSSLVIDPLQGWTLDLQFTDDKSDFSVSDNGDLTWNDGGQTISLHFRSAAFGDEFDGFYGNNIVMLTYDFDGDGRPDTSFGFLRAD